MIRRIALLATSVAVLGITASACGNDPKSAKIRSFTASPALLPTLGGEVTLTWDVRGAESLFLEPGVGTVTGTSHTVVVSETTEFTLIAKKDGRRTTKHATVTCAPPGAVLGQVRLPMTRLPLPDVAVFLNGEATVTDADGNFIFSDVSTPYDVALFDPTFNFAMIWEGLTRFDPILEIPIPFGGAPLSQSISGTVTPTTADVDATTVLFIKNEFESYADGATPDVGTGAYAGSASWTSLFNDPRPADTTLIGVRYVTDPGTLEVEFTHLGTTEVVADPLGQPLLNANVTLAPVNNAISTGSFLLDAEESYNFSVPTFFLDSATGASRDAGFVLPGNSYVVTTALDFTLSTPDTDGEVVLYANCEDVFGGVVYRMARFKPGTKDLQVDFPSAPRLLSPVEGGVYTRETVFQVTSQPSSTKLWAFGSPNTQILLITTRDSVTLPELPEAGIVFYDDDINWSVAELAPLPSGDDAAGPEGLFAADLESVGLSPFRNGFVTGGVPPPAP